MEWRRLGLALSVYAGALGGATTAVAYLAVDGNWPLAVLAFVGLFLFVLNVVSATGGRAAGVADTEEGAIGDLSDGIAPGPDGGVSPVSGVARPGSPLSLAAYGLGLLVWSGLLIATVVG